ncbi:MAG TPA: alanine--glyoxylate aminotransferase family protein [Thermoplasmata archaeon]|nr:alanine--glyoxylate aminotransferase family protein [Thermoplasmata archaeon]
MEAALLLIPGPVPLHPRVQEEMAKPALPHYGDAWVKAFHEAQELQKYVWAAPKGRVFPVFGPGHAGLESLAFTFLRAGDRVVVLENGFFGERVRDVLLTHRVKVDSVQAPWGEGLDPAKLRSALRNPAKAVAVIHNETSTGLTNPLEEIVEISHDAGAFVLVDAVSSLGGLPLPIEKLGVDAAFSASQKCLAAPAGVSPVVVSPSLWEATDPKTAEGWYLNLFTWDQYERDWADWHPTPTTISSNLFYAVHRALLLVKEEGLEARFARHARAAKRLRSGLAALGFTPVAPPELISNTVTCVAPPADMDSNALVRSLRVKHNIYISGGLGPLRGKTVRIGTMGTQAEPEIVDALLDAMRALV